MLELFLAELRRSWIMFSCYPIETISSIFVYTSIFYALFLSANYIAGSSLKFGDRVDSIIIGYVLWTLVSFIFANIAGELQLEAQTGTLEQLFLSRYGAIKVFLMRALADLTLQIVEILAILLIIMILTKSRLYFPPTILLPFIAVVLGANGFALMMGALALIYKRVQQLLSLCQFPLLFLLTTPTETWTGLAKLLAQLLPMSPGTGLLRDLMVRGGSLDLTRLVVACLNGIGYFVVGLLLFRQAEKKAKRQGMLSGY